MADPTDEELIAHFERLCQELRAVRQLIDRDPSPEHLRQAIQMAIAVWLQDGDMQDRAIANLQDRLKRIEDSLGLASEPPASGGASRPSRRQ